MTGTDRLDPAARPLVDLLSKAFPDLGGTVTDAAEARRILASAPAPGRPLLPVGSVGSVEDRTIPGPEGAPELRVRIYLPEAAGGADAGAAPDQARMRGPAQGGGPARAPYPTVVFFHGGGFSICGLDSHDGTVRKLCREAGAAVVSVDYRLAPEAPFPAAVEDAYAAVRWVAGHLGQWGGDPAALVVAGDSAGGALATVAARLARERGGPEIALQVLLYPVLDAAQDTDSYRRNASGYFLTAAHMRWFWEQYLGEAGPASPHSRHPYASPLRAPDLSGLPPAYLLTAGCDPLCDEGQEYASALREAGVRVTEGHFRAMFHGFLGFTEALADSRTAMTEVAGAIAAAGVYGRKNSGDLGGVTG
ncbi:alpha/beta hydrolase fold domain-containing protein [Streptomyces sp. NPDC051561]|uniref:alpha/beta hydrolase fold domain-containing protein n=1 Tax=Streptomyces sp. NPDC051561 TaxID=3365658 RepID=UPI003797B34C